MVKPLLVAVGAYLLATVVLIFVLPADQPGPIIGGVVALAVGIAVFVRARRRQRAQ